MRQPSVALTQIIVASKLRWRSVSDASVLVSGIAKLARSYGYGCDPLTLLLKSSAIFIRAACHGGLRASPVPAATFQTFHAPYAGRFLGAAFPGSSPLPWPSP